MMNSIFLYFRWRLTCTFSNSETVYRSFCGLVCWSYMYFYCLQSFGTLKGVNFYGNLLMENVIQVLHVSEKGVLVWNPHMLLQFDGSGQL